MFNNLFNKRYNSTFSIVLYILFFLYCLFFGIKYHNTGGILLSLLFFGLTILQLFNRKKHKETLEKWNDYWNQESKDGFFSDEELSKKGLIKKKKDTENSEEEYIRKQYEQLEKELGSDEENYIEEDEIDNF